MAEQTEIPEVDSPFGKRVAVTIAIAAVLMAIIANRGDDAKTDALLKTTQAANVWSHFQAKGIKEYTYEIQAKVMAVEAPAGVDPGARAALIKDFESQVQRYDDEKKELKAEAEALQAEAAEAIAINNRCDLASLFMQLAVVACSVAILAHLAIFWWGGIAMAVVGITLGVSSWWVIPPTGPETPARTLPTPSNAATGAVGK